jgi:glycerol-3-phosphate responsive antiterminator
MIIEIFEARGFSEPDTDMDATILNLTKRYGNKIIIRKINVLDKDSMKSNKDVINRIKSDGLEVLPIIKLDSKIVTHDKIEKLMR